MPHECTDWTTTPPTRKVPLLVLTRGDEHIYTIVPAELKTLEAIAREEFGLGDVDVRLSTSCANLCSGLPARITERAWEHLSPYIGCATVDVVARAPPPQEQPSEPENERDAGTKGKQPQENVPDPRPSTSLARDPARDREAAASDHGARHDRVLTPEDRRQESADEGVDMGSPRKARYRRLVVSEDDGDHDESERGDEATTSSGRVIKAERQTDHPLESRAQAAEQLDKQIKQEKHDARNSNRPQPQSQPGTAIQAPTESDESHKLMIRVAHRPSKQESKFTTKGTTRVHKVLSGVCKSFGLDVNRATLYLIVSTEDEDGEQENLFPCDINDNIARAGAERDTESRFLLKIAGET